MYTLVNTNKCSIKEFVEWNDLLTFIYSQYNFNDLSLDKGKNYVDFYNFSNSIYIIGLSQLEIEYFQEKTKN